MTSQAPFQRADEVPIGALVIDVTADSITVDGTLVSTFGVGFVDESPSLENERLRDFIKSDVDRRSIPKPPVGTTIHAPVVIRPVDSTPIRFVDRVIASVAATGDDYVLAAQLGSQNAPRRWTLLSPLADPSVTPGCSGSHDHRHTAAHDVGHDEISLLVEPHIIWLGISPVHQFIEVPRDGNEWLALARRLQELRHKAAFVDRTDLEIAGDLVSYDEVVKAITAANDAGFTSWCVMPPMALSALPAL